MIHVLRLFGWLIHPTKCTGVLEAVQVFRALGTVVDLATQLYSVPAETVDSILRAASARATGPPMAPVQAVAAAALRRPSSARAVAHTHAVLIPMQGLARRGAASRHPRSSMLFCVSRAARGPWHPL